MSGKLSRLEVIHPKSIFDAASPEIDVTELELIGRFGQAAIYASESLIAEVEAVRKLGGLPKDNVYHATSSIALSAIAKHKALLSSKQLLNKGEPLVTGEIATEQGKLHLHNSGLENVYASSSPVSTTYAVLTGNEYPVIFGIDSSPYKSQPSYLPDSGDGIALGSQVPLTHVTAQIVPFEKVPEMQAWSADNCKPDALTMSSDAAFVLNYLDHA